MYRPDHSSEPGPSLRAAFERFRRGGPTEVDVGFGRGHFLIDRARACPKHDVVGIELRRASADRVQARISREGIRNAWAIQGDARAVLPRLFGDGDVDRFFLHFPDPWWKRRHLRRRLVAPELCGLLARQLRPGGAIYVQTDVVEHAAHIRACFECTPGLFNAHGDFALGDWDVETPASHREKRYREAGVRIYRMTFVRAGAAI